MRMKRWSLLANVLVVEFKAANRGRYNFNLLANYKNQQQMSDCVIAPYLEHSGGMNDMLNYDMMFLLWNFCAVFVC